MEFGCLVPRLQLTFVGIVGLLDIKSWCGAQD